MSSEVQLQFDELVHDALVPLLSGGIVKLTRFLHPSLASSFAHGAFSSAEDEDTLRTALHRRASDILEPRVLPFPELGVMQMVMAGHNLLGLTDPKLDRLFSRGSIPKVKDWITELIDAVRPPTTRGAALCRHVFVDALRNLSRQDTTVRNWAYHYRYYGRPPAANVVAMPKLRAVKITRSEAAVSQLIETANLTSLMRSWLRKSPVTELMDMPADIELSIDELAVLSDPRLRHAIACSLMKDARTRRFATPLGDGLLRLLDGKPPSAEEVLPAVLLCAELHILELLATDRVLGAPGEPGGRLYAAMLGRLLGNAQLSYLVELSAPDEAFIRERAANAVAENAELEGAADTLVGILMQAQTTVSSAHAKSA